MGRGLYSKVETHILASGELTNRMQLARLGEEEGKSVSLDGEAEWP
jgi:hypothetical protein